MTAKEAIKGTIQMAQMISDAYLADLKDEDLGLRPAPGVNTIGWQLGHLIASEHKMVSALGVQMPELPAGFADAHDKEAAAADDAKPFASKAEYLALMKKMRDATLAALDAAAESDLDQPGPEEMRAYIPTVGAGYNMIGVHVLMHVGQFVLLRRKLGKPIAI